MVFKLLHGDNGVQGLSVAVSSLKISGETTTSQSFQVNLWPTFDEVDEDIVRVKLYLHIYVLNSNTDKGKLLACENEVCGEYPILVETLPKLWQETLELLYNSFEKVESTTNNIIWLEQTVSTLLFLKTEPRVYIYVEDDIMTFKIVVAQNDSPVFEWTCEHKKETAPGIFSLLMASA